MLYFIREHNGFPSVYLPEGKDKYAFKIRGSISPTDKKGRDFSPPPFPQSMYFRKSVIISTFSSL